MSDQRIPKEKKDSLLTQAREIAADILEYKVINRIHVSEVAQHIGDPRRKYRTIPISSMARMSKKC